MPSCAVAGCSNHNNKTKGTNIKYFSFPKNEDLANKWIVTCGRNDKINLKYARICSIHFEAVSYEIPLKQRLLQYSSIRDRYLKSDAVPSINLPERIRCQQVEHDCIHPNVESNIHKVTSVFHSVVYKLEPLDMDDDTRLIKNEIKLENPFTEEQIEIKYNNMKEEKESSEIKQEHVKEGKVYSDEWCDTNTAIKCEMADSTDLQMKVETDMEMKEHSLSEWYPITESCSSNVTTIKQLKKDTDCNDEQAKHEMGYELEIQCSPENHQRKRKGSSEWRHITEESGRTKDNSFGCVHCDYSANCKQDLLKHMSVHEETKKRLFTCTNCDYSCKRKDSLIRHKLIHYKGRKKLFFCANCDHSTNRKGDLKRHMSVHYKDKGRPFVCNVCDYKTYSNHYMRRHTLIRHLGIYKEHSCKCCEKYFKTKKALDDHIVKVHENIIDMISSKLHKCSSCDYKTTNKGNLTRHIVTQHSKVNATSYKCNVCQYVTYDKSYHAQHLRKHKEVKDYECDVCSKGFTSKRGLDSHIVTIHGEDDRLMKTVSRKIHYCFLCSYKTCSTINIRQHSQRKHKS